MSPTLPLLGSPVSSATAMTMDPLLWILLFAAIGAPILVFALSHLIEKARTRAKLFGFGLNRAPRIPEPTRGRQPA